MRAVAKAAQAAPKTQNKSKQILPTPKPAKSPTGQKSAYKTSATGTETGRAKSQVSQTVTQKKVIPNKGSKTP